MSANSLEKNLHMNPPRNQFSRLRLCVPLLEFDHESIHSCNRKARIWPGVAFRSYSSLALVRCYSVSPLSK